ncbi:MAG: hypothetical protein ACT4O5_01625 [Gammaproteobacteria bacterium]
MSKTGVLLGVSLALNALLVAVFAMPLLPSSGASRSPASEAGDAQVDVVPDDGNPFPASDPAAARLSKPTVAESPSAGSMHILGEHLAELRRRGMDGETVKLLVVAEAERLFRQKARELLQPRTPAEYWQASETFYGAPTMIETAQLEAFQRLRRENLAAIERLVGDAEFASAESNSATTFMLSGSTGFDYLPTGKRLALLEYMESASVEANTDLLGRLRAFSTGNRHQDELKREEQIRFILGPESFDQYVKHSSGSARRLRQELAAFQPSRAEFDALLAIEREYRMRAAEMGVARDATSVAKHESVTEQRRNGIRAALGDQRYDEYEQATDPAFRQLRQIAREMKMSPDVARASYELVEQARARVETLTATRDPRDPKLQAEVAELQRDLQAKLIADLGLQDLSEADAQIVLQGAAINVHSHAQRALRRAQ